MAGDPPYTGPPITFGFFSGLRTGAQPVCAITARDRSGSVVAADPFNQAGVEAEAAIDFLARTNVGTDQAGIVDFADTAAVTGVLPVAGNVSALHAAAKASPAVGGGTSFTSAAAGIQEAISRCTPGSRPIVIFTSDGETGIDDAQAALAAVPPDASTYLIAYGWASGWKSVAPMWRSFPGLHVVVEPRLQPGTTAKAFAQVFEQALGYERVETGP